ncbi:unnamed protein product [Urochloa humidicola]
MTACRAGGRSGGGGSGRRWNGTRSTLRVRAPGWAHLSGKQCPTPASLNGAARRCDGKLAVAGPPGLGVAAGQSRAVRERGESRRHLELTSQPLETPRLCH